MGVLSFCCSVEEEKALNEKKSRDDWVIIRCGRKKIVDKYICMRVCSKTCVTVTVQKTTTWEHA